LKLVYLGFGSNIGDREALLRSALERLEGPNLHLRRISGLYETEPMGIRDQPWFLNFVAEFETSLLPKQLLQAAHRVERELGRRRGLINGPRTVDIDILLYGSSVIQSVELEVPHPRFRERRFVLAPLAELNPALRDPVTGQSVARLLEGLHGQQVRRRAPLVLAGNSPDL